MPASSGTTAGMIGFWNGPVAATTSLRLDHAGAVSARKRPSGLRVSAVTSTPQRIGASMRAA